MNWMREQLIIYSPLAVVGLLGAGLIAKVVLDSRYPEIDVSDQKLVDGKVIVDRAFLKTDGFIAIHESERVEDLSRSSPIGHAALGAGSNFKVEIKLSKPVASGSTLFAVLHADADADGRFSFEPGNSGKNPIKQVGGKPVAVPFSVN